MKILKKDLLRIIKQYLNEDKDDNKDDDKVRKKGENTSSTLSSSNVSYLTKGNTIEHTDSGLKYTVDSNNTEERKISAYRPNPEEPEENDMFEIEYSKLHKKYELV